MGHTSLDPSTCSRYLGPDILEDDMWHHVAGPNRTSFGSLQMNRIDYEVHLAGSTREPGPGVVFGRRQRPFSLERSMELQTR